MASAAFLFARTRRLDAEATLEPLSEAERTRLVAAISGKWGENLLNLSSTRISVEDPSSREAKWCLERYFAELGERFEEGFDSGRSIRPTTRS